MLFACRLRILRIPRRAIIVLLAIVAWLVTIAPLGADQPVDPYESDPLRLIAFRDQNQPVGATVVNVWICGLPEDNSLIDIDEAIDILKADYVPFITWLSGGRLGLDIRRAGTAPAIPYRTGGLDTHVCEGRPELHGLEKPWTAGAVLRLQRAVRGYLSMGIDLAQDPVVANIAWAGQTNRAVFEEGIVYLGSPLIGRGTVPTTKARFSAVGELYTPVNTDLFSQFLLGTPSVNRYWGNSTGGCSRRPELLAVKTKRQPSGGGVLNYGSQAYV